MTASRHAFLLTLLLAVGVPPVGPASAQSHARESVPLHVGFGRTSFLSVNLTDAKAAFKVFTRSVGERQGYDLDVTVHTFESDAAFTAAVTNHTLQLVIMVVWDYLGADLETHLEPRFLAIEAGQGPREYLLLVGADSPYQHLRDLRGKNVSILENTNCEMSLNWMKTMLLEEGLGDSSTFFADAVTEQKPAKALLPVFFGQRDACLVNRPVLDMMSELNPQIGRSLRAIAVSAPLVDAGTYVAYDGWIKPHHRDDLIDSLETLHQDPHGQQILTLFKAEQLAPFKEADVIATRELKARHDRLLKQEVSP